MNKTNWNANQKKMYLVDWLNIIPRELKERGECYILGVIEQYIYININIDIYIANGKIFLQYN